MHNSVEFNYDIEIVDSLENIKINELMYRIDKYPAENEIKWAENKKVDAIFIYNKRAYKQNFDEFIRKNKESFQIRSVGSFEPMNL